jgi:hypothetical protein
MGLVKPEILYSASQNRNINIFEPRENSIRDPNEGPVVFATPDKAYASMFIIPSNDSWTNKGQYQGQYYQVISDEKRYKNLDKGGAIYTFKSDDFETDLTKGMRNKEWISKKPVKPINKEIYESGLGAMKQLGVKIFFVNPDIFLDFRQKLTNGMIKEAFDLISTNQ